MFDSAVHTVGSINLVLFFAADYYVAYLLNEWKRDHPVIDECAPPLDDEDTNAASRAADASPAPDGVAHTAFALPASLQNASRVHLAVVVASILAPLIAFFQVVAPGTMAWSFFHVPVWLGYLTVVPGLCLGIFYVLRALRLSQCPTVSKSEWMAVMWFRLDVVCIMATLLLLGWGDWLVALCLYAMDLYLAQRLLITERRLIKTTQRTQLLRDELDSRDEAA